MRADSLVYAIDIGDSVIRAGVYRNGRTTLVATEPTPKEDLVDVIDSDVWRIVAELVGSMRAAHPGGIGLALSASGTMTLRRAAAARTYGPFRDHEVVVYAPNIDGLKHAPILLCVERLDLGLPIHIENDMNAALFSATHFDEAILVGLGAGLGGAIKKSGEVEHLPGTWSSFEIGHGRRWVMGEHFNRRCNCGTFGCLEAAIGGWAMAERYMTGPEYATPESYARMRSDVVSLLPQAIARLVNAARIPTVLMAGKGSLGYALGSDFILRLKQTTQRLVPEIEVDIRLIDLGEVAELHGAALAFLHNVGPDLPSLGAQNSDLPASVFHS